MVNIPDSDNCESQRPYRLKNTIQYYEWGCRNDRAFIAHLLGIDPEGGKPFAELWMGVHPKAPSLVIDPQKRISQTLSDWISEAPARNFHSGSSNLSTVELPYLLKVLSADQALSIQAHPNKAQAKVLHSQDPDHYPDYNHKPEIAIAIDHLDALIGFISQDEYDELLESTPELKNLFFEGRKTLLDLRSAVFYLLELSSNNIARIATCISKLSNRLQGKGSPNDKEQLFLDLLGQQDNSDVGLLFLFFLNRVHLGPGEAVFLAPGVPHAYLKGNIIECMANSDNVVRLGLTKKFCDASALLRILSFDSVQDFAVKTSSDGFLTEYLTPTVEFTVKTLDLLQGESRAFTFRTALTMFLVLDGQISLRWGNGASSCTCVYRRGDSFVAPASLRDFNIQAKSHSKLFLVDIPKVISSENKSATQNSTE